MDNSQQTPQQVNPVAADNSVQQVPQQPAQPVGSLSKEHGPVAEVKKDKLIEPSEKAPEVPKELKEVGVEEIKEHPQVPQAAKDIGVSLAKESTPVQVVPQGIVHLPMTQVAAKQVVQKKNDPALSVRWLAGLILKLLKQESTHIN